MKYKNKNVMKIYRWVLLSVCILFLYGCASNGLVKAKMHLNGAHYLNPDINGRPSPVLVSFYELTTPMAFKQAKYFQLQQNPAAVLGASLQDKQTVSVRPGQVLIFPLKMATSVRYVGITAGFRNIDQARWRAVIPVSKPDKHWYKFWGNTTTAKVELLSQGIKVQLIK